MFISYFMGDFEMVPVASVIIGIRFVLTVHIHSIVVIRAFYARIISASFFITFRLQELQLLLTCMFLVYYHGL